MLFRNERDSILLHGIFHLGIVMKYPGFHCKYKNHGVRLLIKMVFPKCNPLEDQKYEISFLGCNLYQNISSRISYLKETSLFPNPVAAPKLGAQYLAGIRFFMKKINI
jgi:hypothetical protein